MAGITKKRNLNPKRRGPAYPRVVKKARHNSCRVKAPATAAPAAQTRSASAGSHSAQKAK